ncbi:glycerophosphoinositol permease [Tilletia horrida]|nr:glycerophosphoinositol permease [Tilletia horrida]
MADDKVFTPTKEDAIEVLTLAQNGTTALEARDNEKPQQGLGKVASIFACGAALFSDGYVNAITGPVGSILKRLYKDENPGRFTHFKKLFSSLGFAGTVLGMLVWGVLSDRVGRKSGMIFASIWLALFSVLSAGAWGAGGSIDGLFACRTYFSAVYAIRLGLTRLLTFILITVIAYRFIQGIAIGAEYPAGSVACSENTEAPGVNKKRQQMYFSLATNTMIDWGFVVAYFVPLLLIWIFGMNHLTLVWRLSLGLGAIPPLTLLYFRTKMEEPIHYRKSSIKFSQMPWWLIVKRYWVRLAAISIAWFVYDFVSYPAGGYADYIVGQVLPANASFQANLGWGVVINLFYIPGTLIGVLVNDRLGPKNTMIVGLLLQAVIGFGLSAGYSGLKNHIAGFAILYGLFLSAGEFGAGNNLGLLASKAAGPTAVRGTFYGIAAAIGKIGAFVGTYVYTPISNSLAHGDDIGSGLAVVSALVIYFGVPNIGEDSMLKEDEEFRRYLEANGYDTSLMGTENFSTPSLESPAASVGPALEEEKHL